jgi:hypothetical protein
MITPGPLAGHQGHTPDLRLGDPLDDELEQFAVVVGGEGSEDRLARGLLPDGVLGAGRSGVNLGGGPQCVTPADRVILNG